jgi:hypothetical protein
METAALRLLDEHGDDFKAVRRGLAKEGIGPIPNVMLAKLAASGGSVLEEVEKPKKEDVEG